jgi:hypothetical protein
MYLRCRRGGLGPHENVEIRLRHSDLCHIRLPLAADRCLFLQRGTKKGLCVVLFVLISACSCKWEARGRLFGWCLGGDRVLFLGRGSRKLLHWLFALLILTLFLFHTGREIAACFSFTDEGSSLSASRIQMKDDRCLFCFVCG